MKGFFLNCIYILKSTSYEAPPDEWLVPIAGYALSVFCFALFRWLLLSLHQIDILYSGMERHWLVAEAFVIGFRFDTVIACYLLAPPFLLLALPALAGKLRTWMLRIGYWYIGVVFTAAFFLCAADIQFFLLVSDC